MRLAIGVGIAGDTVEQVMGSSLVAAEAELRLRQEMQQHVGIVGVEAHRGRKRLERLRRPAGVYQRHADADEALSVVRIELDRSAVRGQPRIGVAAPALLEDQRESQDNEEGGYGGQC